MAAVEVSVIKTTRIRPAGKETITPLSLLDCTTADFAYPSAIWLYERPRHLPPGARLGEHLGECLAKAIEHYPQWCGNLKMVMVTDGTVDDEGAKKLPRHARRFGRIYSHYGTAQDPGAEYIYAKSPATLDDLYPARRTVKQPLWDRNTVPLDDFMAKTQLIDPLQPNVADENGNLKPLLAVQLTQLGCGGFIIGIKGTHPMTDTGGFMWLLKDWASVSRSVLTGEPVTISNPVFKPELLDNMAAGDINADRADPEIVRRTESLPLHRYDWWASAATCPWPISVPEPFRAEEMKPTGKLMPWSEWDVTSPVGNYVVHYNRDQIEQLWLKANKNNPQRPSRHDAILAHIWACIMRARNLPEDVGPVHCDLVLGVRGGLKLPEKFLGSPIIIMNVEMPGKELTAAGSLGATTNRIRDTVRAMSRPENISAHLHSLAFEKSPQRIWQAFLGQRHILATTWGRAGIYDIDFGFGSACLYVEGVLPNLNGGVLIKEAPCVELDASKASTSSSSSSSSPYWTDNGVDISVHIRTEDYERLAKDPLLFPSIDSISQIAHKPLRSVL